MSVEETAVAVRLEGGVGGEMADSGSNPKTATLDADPT